MQGKRSYTPWIVLGIVVVLALWLWGSYNGLVGADQAVQSQWAQVQNVYQRRADLVPNLVATVKGAANFEKSTYTAVTEARAKVGQVAPQAQNAPNNAQSFQQYAAAQDQLGSTLSRLLVVSENYPQLKATQNFETLQSQLEGTENRITVERKRYNEVAQAYNTKRLSFPTVLIANMFGFGPKQYFAASEAAQTAPTVDFSKP